MRNTHFNAEPQNAQVALRKTHLLWTIAGMKTGERIREIRKLKGLTLSDVENAAGLAEGNLSRIERGQQWLSEDKLYAVANALGVDPSEFFITNRRAFVGKQDANDPRSEGKLPLISDVQAGNWSEIVDNFEPGDAEDWIPCPFNHGPNAFVLRVAGTSMLNPGGDKSYAPGEYIAVDPQIEPQNRRMVVVKIDHEERATFKQLLIEPDGTYLLQALNPAWPNKIMALPPDSRIVGVVIGKWTPE